MSDTVILALISSVSALAVAIVGCVDRHQLHRQGIRNDASLASDLVKANAA